MLGTFGDLSADDGAPDLHVDGGPPDLPPPEQCTLIVPAAPFPPPFMGHVELRMHPDDADFLEGRRSGTPRMRGWFRLPDDEPVDTITLLTAVDAFPPTIFNADLPVGWTPTLELTAHVRARPAPGWRGVSVHDALRDRRFPGGRRRGVGRHRSTGGAVTSAGARAPPGAADGIGRPAGPLSS